MRTCVLFLLLAVMAVGINESKAATKKAPATAPKVRFMDVSGGYVVVVSKKTQSDPAWKKVVEILKKKYHPKVLVWDKKVDEVFAALAKEMPRYTCFVARPKETGRAFVVHLHRSMRKLDKDPYTDTQWAILTGREAKDAASIAATCDPLIVRRGLGTTGFPMGLFEKGLVISDGTNGKIDLHNMKIDKKKYGEKAGSDRSQLVVDMLKTMRPDMLTSASHASERDLQMPFGCGALMCKNGDLYGVNIKEKSFRRIVSPNPKVYLAIGNCLLGHVNGPDAVSLAFMRSANVKQLVGYTVVTWFGRGGWGVNTWFFPRGGRFSLAESWYINNQTLVYELENEFGGANCKNTRWNLERDRSVMGNLARQLGYQGKKRQKTTPKKMKRHLGLTWDVDTVALYGDPAWVARMPKRDLKWNRELKQKGKQWTLTITAKEDVKVGSVFAFFPKRIDVKTLKMLSKKAPKAVITDNFIYLPKVDKVTAKQPLVIRFQAKTL